jgi:restriction endonuclease-like protein
MGSDFSVTAFLRASQLRADLALRNRLFARNHPHVESYGSNPVIVYAPENGRHGNFYPPAYTVIAAHPEWIRRFNKIHAQGRSLPRPQIDPPRKWRELDSCMSSDALLMNIFCTSEVTASPTLRRAIGIDTESDPTFGWKARVPLKSTRVDRTEVDMRWGDLLVEAKLTESDFQCREAHIVEAYRDLDEVFDRDLLPRVQIRTRRRREAVEFAEEFTQEWEPPCEGAEEVALEFHAEIEARADAEQPWHPGYACYQLIRNVLAAYAAGASFCVIHDQRRPDLRESWFQVMRAVKSADMRTRCKALTWQEIVPHLPAELRDFLDVKYGIVAPGCTPLTIEELEARARGESKTGMRK